MTPLVALVVSKSGPAFLVLRMFYFKNGACPSKILDGNHFSRWLPFLLNPYINSSNGDAIITFGTNILQGTFSLKKVSATQKLKMATIFKMATISVRGQCNVLRKGIGESIYEKKGLNPPKKYTKGFSMDSSSIWCAE